jgi:hypothetical protein
VFSDAKSDMSSTSFPNSLGIVLWNWFLDASRKVKHVKCPSSVGREPVNLFSVVEKYKSKVSFPNSVGIVLLSWLLDALKKSNLSGFQAQMRESL